MLLYLAIKYLFRSLGCSAFFAMWITLNPRSFSVNGNTAKFVYLKE